MLADGTTTVYSQTYGREYESLFPVLNWTLLPGTTEVQNIAQDSEPPATECSRIRDGDIHKSFVAGLADGDVGVSAMDFARSKLLAPLTTVRVSCNANTSEPQPGMHCQIYGEIAIGAPSAEATAEQCRQRCCITEGCSCWTWTTYERDDAPPCKQGGNCCWLKWQSKPLVPAINCTGGMVPGRSRPRPSPQPKSPQLCVQAGKAWFFTPNVTLALGTDIRRGVACSDMSLTTSLQQSNLFGSVWVGDGTQPAQMIPNNTNLTLNLATAADNFDRNYWVWHDGLAYVIMVGGGNKSSWDGTSLTVSNQVRTGDREQIIESGSNATIWRQVFTVFISHPSSPSTSYDYAYAIVPSPSVVGTDALLNRLFGPQGEVTIVSNIKPLQAVCTRQQLMQMIVWPALADVSERVVVHGNAAGCWDILQVTFNNMGAVEAGVLLQIRATTEKGAFAISAVAPPAGTKQGYAAVTIHVAGLALHGDACSVAGAGTDGAGTDVTIGLNITGATNVVHCQSISLPRD
jgi:hypothetical protein